MLDTFDMFSPANDQPQDEATLAGWFAEGGFDHVEVFRDGLLIGRGVNVRSDAAVPAPVPGAFSSHDG